MRNGTTRPTDQAERMRGLLPLAAAAVLVVACASKTTPSPTVDGGAGDGSQGIDSGGRGGSDAPSADGGDGAGGGGASGSGGVASTLVLPIARPGGKYVLEFGELYFEVDAQVGARVTSLRLGPTSLLTGTAENLINYGATFWTSPQTAWNAKSWPPPPEIDNQPYSTSTPGDEAILAAGNAAASVGAAVTKRFTPDLARQAIVVEYTIQAKADGKTFAPWEVTRVYPGGITFYPTGDLAPVTSGTFSLPALQTAAGCTWFKWPASVGSGQKLIADGKEGWIAHVTSDGTLLVKKFPDIAVADRAPGEGEISIFADSKGKYEEVEMQGPYRPVPSGQSLSWTVIWFVRKLPADIGATIGSQALVDHVRSLVK